MVSENFQMKSFSGCILGFQKKQKQKASAMMCSILTSNAYVS